MPKASLIDVGRHTAGAAGRFIGACASVLALLAGAASPAAAQQEASEAAASSLRQVIEAAKLKKAQELEAAARRLLGTDGRPAAADTSLLPPPVARPSHEVPRVWSLSGVDRRLEAELYYQGRIYPVRLAGERAAHVGPWVVRSITPAGVTVAWSSDAAPPAPAVHGMGSGPGATSRGGASRVQGDLLLPVPGRGSSLGSYAFHAEGTGGGIAALAGDQPLPPSALRASQLPYGAAAPAAGALQGR